MLPVRKVTLKQDTHQYFDENNEEYQSVSGLIQMFTPAFDTAFRAANTAAREGRTVEEVIKSWADNNKLACDHGSLTHEIIEAIVRGENVEVGEHINPVKQMIEKFQLEGRSMFAEKILYHPLYFVAGTTDLLLQLGGKKVAIYDWKTNKDDLKWKAGYYQKSNGVKTDKFIETNETMLGPLSHLPHCKGIMYSLQLSLYRYILEEWGMDVQFAQIIHLREGKDAQWYKPQYYKEEAQIMLENWKTVRESRNQESRKEQKAQHEYYKVPMTPDEAFNNNHTL